MLSKFRIKNYRSIRELTVDMSYGEGKAPNGYKESSKWSFLEDGKKRLVPVLALYGANASGKSNIIKAMELLHDFIVQGLHADSSTFNPNRLNPPSETTTFGLECTLHGDIYEYSLDYDNSHIAEEKLLCNGKELFRAESGKGFFTGITTETYSKNKLTDIYVAECCKETDYSLDRQHKTILSVLGKNYAGLNPKVTGFFNFFKNKVVILNGQDIPLSFGLKYLTEFFAKEGYESPEQKAFDAVVTGLKKLDINIKGLLSHYQRNVFPIKTNMVQTTAMTLMMQYAEKIEEKDGNIVIDSRQIISQHKDINGNLVNFDFHEAESMGTQILAGLLGVIFRSLKEGCVVFADEFDRSIHPFLITALINYFKGKAHNEKNSQLIFSLHDTYLLENNQMRVSEIGIIEKTLKSGSTLHRLCEDKTLRNVSNFKQLYLNGVYGGIPFPYQ